MLESFFQLGPLPANTMTGWYDDRLVVLSYLVATFASYIALDITARLRDINNTPMSMTLWLCGGALAMGAGIWSMHFIGMLAFNLPMPMIYDPAWTFLSMAVAIGASAFALFLLKPKAIHLSQIILGGVVLGFAIAAMHYTGMQAMKIDMGIHYKPGLFFLSIAIAIFASEAALWLAIKSTQVLPQIRFRLKFFSAFIMGAAICGMHYTGMAAAVFTHQHSVNSMSSLQGTLSPNLMAISVAGVTFIILCVAFVVSSYKDSVNQQLLLTARQAGMAEVAASVLHNVGNVLNSLSVSSNIVAEKINNSKLDNLKKLSQLMNEHKNNFSSFVNEDPRGRNIPEFTQQLSAYWDAEQSRLKNELHIIIKNIDHIKSIIASQQDLSRSAGVEQAVSIKSVLDEALLISGMDNVKYNIEFEKKYEQIKPIMIDKVKLLQILVNILQNAKESLLITENEKRNINLSISPKSDGFVYIVITDNGIGIPKEYLVKIFAYGFTTKKEGHGFGLHTSAISAKEMGGELSVQSAGKNKGASFILKVPYKTI